MNVHHIRMNTAALSNALNLFDPNMDDTKKLDVRVALETILQWYIRYRNEYKEFPTAPPIQYDLNNIAKYADDLVAALNNAHAITKRILNVPNPYSLSVIFGREWQGFVRRKNEHAIYPITSEFMENLQVLSSWAKNRAWRIGERDHLKGPQAWSEHSLAELILPSPTIFLMRECGLLLVANGRGTNNLLKIAKFVHIQALEKKELMSKRWGESAATAVRKWLKDIQPIIGGFMREAEDGTKSSCIFPTADNYPNRYDATVWKCVIPDLDGTVNYGKYDLDGPGWPDLTKRKGTSRSLEKN